jgi:hypothetical protein
MKEEQEKEVLEIFKNLNEMNRNMFLSYGRIIRAASEAAIQEYATKPLNGDKRPA